MTASILLGGRASALALLLVLFADLPSPSAPFHFPLRTQTRAESRRKGEPLRACAVRCATVTRKFSKDSVAGDGEKHVLGVPIIAGDIVLSDWVDELPSVEESMRDAGSMELLQKSSGRGSSRLGVDDDNTEGDDDSTPFRFQQLIQRMWAELSRNDQLAYLGSEGQTRVKSALTVLGAYGALREHPFQAGMSSPQQAFLEMDINRDGEVSFDEFVRWYLMSSAVQPDESLQPQEQSTQPASGQPAGTKADIASVNDRATSPSSSESPTTNLMTPAPTAGVSGSKTDGASRLMADLEGLTRAIRPRGQNAVGALTNNQPPPVLSGERVQQRSAASVVTGSQGGRGRHSPPGAAATDHVDTHGGDWPVVLAPTAVSSWSVEDASGRRVATDAEKDAFRERWLAGGTVSGNTGALRVPTSFPDASNEAGVTGGGRSAAEEDLEKAMELLSLLVKANADADTLIAALASRMIRNPTGRYNLEVIEEQFGPIIRGIVEDRLLLERLPEPVCAANFVAIRQSRGLKAVLDLDDHHAKVVREYMVHASKDARAVVVHMADLTCRLREINSIPEYARHSLALEALQLYVPVSNALGLESSFRELEELGYKTLFPQTYATIGQWHRDVRKRSHDILLDVKERMLHALQSRKDIANRVHRYRIDGRTKGLVSTFRKVFRQNKRVKDVHDIIGLRVIVEPRGDDSSHAQHHPHAAPASAAANRFVGSDGEDGGAGGLLESELDASGVRVPAIAVTDGRNNQESVGVVPSVGGSGSARQGHGECEDGEEVTIQDVKGRRESVGDNIDVVSDIGSDDELGSQDGGARYHTSEPVGENCDRRECGDRMSSRADNPPVGKSTETGLSVLTLNSFPPPYRDSDSRLLHDVYEVLVGMYSEVPGRYKNYVDFPKVNGYRSVHTTVLHPTAVMMELQVRTAKMHRDAEGGAAAHSLYKGDLKNPDEALLFRSKMTPPAPSPPPSRERVTETQNLLTTTEEQSTGSNDDGGLDGIFCDKIANQERVESPSSSPNAEEP